MMSSEVCDGFMRQRKCPMGDTNQRREIGTRTLVNAPISFIVERIEGGGRVATGTGTLKNLSLRGALITDLRIAGGVRLDEHEQYNLRFTLMVGPFAGLEAVCNPVRYDPESNGFGVRMPHGFKFPIS